VTSNVLTQALDAARKRMDQLRAGYEEYLELEAYVQQMENFRPTAATGSASKTPQAASTRRPTNSRQRPGTGQRPGTTKTPSRATANAAQQEAQGATVAKIKEIVAAHPEGISIGDIISEGQLSTSYTYDVVKRLVERGEFEKKNRKIFTHARGRSQRTTATTRNGDGAAAQEQAASR